MSTTTPQQFERTAPVFAGRKIVIAIDSENPLSTQLEMITGDGWNSIDWTDTLKTGEITHKKSGLVVKVLPSPDISRALLMYAVFGVLKICGNSYVNTCTEQWLGHAASFGAYPQDGPFIGKVDDVEARFEGWLETIGGLPEWPDTQRQAARYEKMKL